MTAAGVPWGAFEHCDGPPIGWWEWSRCDHSARAERAARVTTGLADETCAPLCAARRLAARAVPTVSRPLQSGWSSIPGALRRQLRGHNERGDGPAHLSPCRFVVCGAGHVALIVARGRILQAQ